MKMNKFKCPLGNPNKICKKNHKKKNIKTRSGVRKILYYCKNCDFEFFRNDPKKNLVDNKLDVSRLHKVGISIPKISEEYKNGLNQSGEYIKKYIDKSDKFHKILEIGCGLGYFLDLARKKKCIPYGLELNKFKKDYVNQRIKIRCEDDLNKYKNIKFKKIFMFYSFEYIKNPYEYLIKLKTYLIKNGSITIITPNKNDALKDILDNDSYKKFFYEENSINYFSIRSMEHLAKNVSFKKYNLFTHQGYSIVNFINWFLNHKPQKTGYVGEDRYINYLKENLKVLHGKNNYKNNNVKKILLKIFDDANKKFRLILENSNLGNQVILELKN
jgi:hypothetical protein